MFSAAALNCSPLCVVAVLESRRYVQIRRLLVNSPGGSTFSRIADDDAIVRTSTPAPSPFYRFDHSIIAIEA